MAMPTGPWLAATSNTGQLVHAVRPVIDDQGAQVGYACPCGRGRKLAPIGILWAELDEDILRCFICDARVVR